MFDWFRQWRCGRRGRGHINHAESLDADGWFFMRTFRCTHCNKYMKEWLELC